MDFSAHKLSLSWIFDTKKCKKCKKFSKWKLQNCKKIVQKRFCICTFTVPTEGDSELKLLLSANNLEMFLSKLNDLGVEIPADIIYLDDDDFKLLSCSDIEIDKFKKMGENYKFYNKNG